MADQTKKIVHQNIIRERANTARGDSQGCALVQREARTHNRLLSTREKRCLMDSIRGNQYRNKVVLIHGG